MCIFFLFFSLSLFLLMSLLLSLAIFFFLFISFRSFHISVNLFLQYHHYYTTYHFLCKFEMKQKKKKKKNAHRIYRFSLVRYAFICEMVQSLFWRKNPYAMHINNLSFFQMHPLHVRFKISNNQQKLPHMK